MSVERYETAVWTLTLPKKWQAESDDECTTIYHQDGVGALQIETFQKEGEVLPADLQQLAEPELAGGVEVSELRVGDFNGFTFSIQEDDEVWRYWFVAAGNCALVATYNSDIEGAEKEAGAVLEILRSLRLN